MRDVRKGNDISVVWSLMRDGQPFDLAGLPLTLYLRNMYGSVKVDDFSVSGNQIRWVFYGKNQKHTGKYSLTLVSNEGVEGMMTTDACDFVNLVSCSCKVGNGADECGVQTETIELTSTIEYLAGGGTISIEIDSELSEVSTNPVENRVITGAFKEVNEDIEGIQNKLEEVAYKDELINIATSVQLCISPLNGADVVKNVFKDNNLAERLGEPISCLVKKDDFEEHYRQMTLVATKVDESQYRMDFSEIGTAPYAGGFGESGRVISEELLWTPGTTVLVKKTISYLYDLSSDYVFPLGESNIPDTFFINLKGLIANYKYDYEGDSYFNPVNVEKFFGMSGSELRSIISNPLVTVVVCYPTEATSPLEVGRTIPLTKRVVGETILLEFAGREFFITISLDSRNFMRYSIESRTFLTEEKADETFVNKTDLATINGQRIDEGGNIIIESSVEEYDDTALKAEIAKKADKDGVYPDMSVGKSANLLGVADGEEAEFLFRATDGDGSIKDGFASIERIEGNSVVLNQHYPTGWTYSVNGVISVSVDGVISIEGTMENQTIVLRQFDANILNHKYLFILSGASSKMNGKQFALLNRLQRTTISGGAAYLFHTNSNDASLRYIGIDGLSEGELVAENDIRVNQHDLTQMFRAGNEPTTIEEFYARIPQGVDLNAYNEGEVINMSADSIKTVGFNAWDEEWENGTFNTTTGVNINTDVANNSIRCKTLIPIIGGETYYCNEEMWIILYDSEKKVIPSPNLTTTQSGNSFYAVRQKIIFPKNAAYMRFYLLASYGSSYNHDICIHLVHTGYRNGEYEPYVSNEKALPIADYFPNGMNAIGDVKDELTPTEAIQRIGVVDLGDLEWVLTSQMYFRAYLPSDSIIPTSVNYNGFLCAKYERVNFNLIYGQSVTTPCFGVSANNGMIGVYDSSYTDAATFKTAMSGVMLYYELAEPIVTKIDTPLDLTYPAWDFGTEEIIADTPTTPFKGSIIYEFNARDTIRANKKAIEGMAIEDYADGKLKVSINGVSRDFMAATPSGDPMHYMYVTAGAEYNDTGADITRTGVYGDTIVWKAGYWWLNELGDITNEEMKIIYSYRYVFPSPSQIKGYYQAFRKTRIMLIDVPARASALDVSYFTYSTAFENIALSQSEELVYVSNMSVFMAYAQATKIINGLDLTHIKSAAAMKDAFLNAAKLIEVRLYLLPVSVEFAQSSLLSNASILYMIENEAATSAIVITLHADAYARAMADEAITTALEAHPNVSLASA